MPRALISLGANLGQVREAMSAAGNMLVDTFGSDRVRFSQLYRTPPVGGPAGQGDFLNAVAAVETESNCWEIWETIKRIEQELGRQRQLRWEARRIDIDLLLCDDTKIWTPHLKVPHPRMCMRSFVLVPALEVASDWIDPVSNLSIRALNLRRSPSAPDANQDHLLLVSNSTEILDRIHSTLDIKAIKENGFHIRNHVLQPKKGMVFECIPIELISSTCKLLVACVSSPDPESVLWEDFNLEWASALAFTAQAPKPSQSFEGPRYLLPANDIRWAAHEIEAASSALRCPIDPTGIPVIAP